MRLTASILFVLVFTTIKAQQILPTYMGDASWHKVPRQLEREPLPIDVTTYPVKKITTQNKPVTIFQRRIDPGTVILHNGPTVPVVEKIRITGKKLPSPRVIPAPPLQTKDNPGFNISYTDKKHGFAANSVMDFAEDAQHNIWIASDKGLVRYDGYHYYLYEDDLSLQDISDCSLAMDAQQRLWMATENGVYFFRNDSLFSIQSPEADLSSIACKRVMIDRYQRVWISTKNKGVLCIDGDSVKVYDKRCGLPGNYFETVYLDKKGNLYMACRSFGIVLVEPSKMRMFFGHNKKMQYSIFLSFYEDEDGIWAGSFFSGVMRLGQKDTLQYSITGKFRESVYDIKKAPGGIWFSCYGNALAYFNKKDLLLFNESNGLLNNLPFKLYEDSFQNIWVANGSGFSRINENCFYMADFTNTALGAISNILPDRERRGNWITTYGKNLVYEEGNKATTYYYNTPGGIPLMMYASASVLDNDGTIWMESYGEGIAHVTGNRFTLYSYSNFTDHKIIPAIKIDAENRIWFCPTRFGLIVHEKNNTFWHYTKKSGLLSDDVSKLFLDTEKNIQCSFPAGFQRFNGPYIETFYVGDRIFKDQVNDILYPDSQTTLLATRKSGLLMIKNKKVYQFSTANGLISDNTRSLIQDTKGRIWLCTEKGIESFYLKDLYMIQQEIFDKSSGPYILDAANVNAFLDSTGLPYWVAGNRKLVFNEVFLHSKKNAPVFSFNKATIDGHFFSPEEKIEILPDQRIQLDYKTIYWGRENNLKLTYLLVSTNNDTTERESQNNGSIIIRDVFPGNYHVLLKAKDNMHVYYSNSINIIVRNFWYNTWLFRIVISILAISGIIFYFRQKARRQLIINELLKKKVWEQTATIQKEKDALVVSYKTIDSQNKEKDVLIEEINHRVKNNLQFIAAILELQLDNQVSNDVIQALLGTSRRIKAMSLIHELLYTKQEQKGLSMREYIQQLVDNLIEMAIDESHYVNIEMKVDDLVMDSNTALPLGMIISELVSNSLKHAFKGIADPEVRIQLKHDPITGLFSLIVSDNGNGYQQQPASNNGLGSNLVDIFSRQLAGTYTIQSGGSFTYELQFKLLNHEQYKDPDH